MVKNVVFILRTFSLYLVGAQDLFFGEKKSSHIYRRIQHIGAASNSTAGTSII